MALLNNLFDILRGWPHEGAIEDTFLAKVTGGTPVALPPGTVVEVQSDGSVDKATTGDLTAVDPAPVWVVIESNQDFSGTFLGKVVCLRANAEFRLDPSNLAVGSYPPGTLLSFSAGKWQPAAIKNQVIGEVLQDNTAVDGTIRVYYSGGMAAKKT
jgi:hypothetical protein